MPFKPDCIRAASIVEFAGFQRGSVVVGASLDASIAGQNNRIGKIIVGRSCECAAYADSGSCSEGQCRVFESSSQRVADGQDFHGFIFWGLNHNSLIIMDSYYILGLILWVRIRRKPDYLMITIQQSE